MKIKKPNIKHYLFVGKNYILKIITDDDQYTNYSKIIKTYAKPFEEKAINLGEFIKLYQNIPSKLAFQYFDDKTVILDFYTNMMIDDKLNISRIDWINHQSLGKIRFIAEI